MAPRQSPPVAAALVRLTCRYSNGVVKSFLASAVSLRGGVLEVVATEQFEPGIELTAVAPFLSGPQPCHVANVRRAQKPGHFLVDLKLHAPVKTTSVQARATGTGVATSSAGPDGKSAPASVGVFAQELAARLEAAGRKPYYQAVFERALPRESQGFLASTAAAVLLLLERKGHLDASAVLRKMGKG